MKVERRAFKVEVRKDAGCTKISGTAVVFNQLSENLGGFRELISPSAFDDCDMSDVRCLFNHDENHILGRTVSKTLRITRDDSGLHFECDVPDTTLARDLSVSMDRGDVDQCSFSFTVPSGGAEWKDGDTAGSITRTVKKISRLFDVSVVTYPAYPQTSANIRSYTEILSERPAPQVAVNPVDVSTLRRRLEIEFYGRQ